MENYYFYKIDECDEAIDFYNYLSNDELLSMLNSEFEEIDCNLTYYANLLREIFNGLDYDEHYYNLISLSEALNNIKIILNILRDRNF